jgi:TonB-linked SusC/RagA family outer membrane protein
LEANGRYDGSSRFPKKDRFALFPSVSAAWRMDREKFMNQVRWINMLKFRGSYGSLGNQAVSAYGYISTMNSGLATPVIDDQRPLTVNAPTIVSANYSWEIVTTINGGIDLGFFDSRLTSTFDIYRRNTTGMLVPGKELPATLGLSAPNENAADLKTTGWEWTLSYNNAKRVASKWLSFNARFVLSDSRSFITRFDNPSKRFTQYYEGMEIGEMWGLVNDGFFNSQAEIDALDERDIVPWDALAIVKGWPKYVDIDQNGRIEVGTSADDPKDVKIIGNSSPRYNYGLNLGASWDGFDFDMFIQGVGKRDFYPIHFLYWGFYQQPYAGGYRHLLDFYRENDDPNIFRHSQAYIDAGLASQNLNAKYPVLQSWLADRNLGEWPSAGTRGLAIPQTGYKLNGAYLRIKSLTIGYSLPRTLTAKAGIQRLRLYVSGENLFEFSELKRYFDPEAINSTDVNNMTKTSNGYTYPFQRRYTMGLHVTF